MVAVNIRDMDDVDRSTALVNGKFLKYNSTTGKFVGADATGESDDIQFAILDNSGTPELATGITAAEVRTLIGAGTSSFDGAYGSLSGRPTIPADRCWLLRIILELLLLPLVLLLR